MEITYRKTESGEVEKVTVEVVETSVFDDEIQSLREQVAGFEVAKAEAQARITDMDGRIAEYQQKIASLEDTKTEVVKLESKETKDEVNP